MTASDLFMDPRITQIPSLALHLCLQIKTPRYWIVSVHHPVDDRRVLVAQVGDDKALVVRIVMWDTTSRAIVDVKEQLIELAPPSATLAFYQALHNVLSRLNPDEVASTVPYDLLGRKILSAAMLRKATSIEDYERALVTAGRLGPYVAP